VTWFFGLPTLFLALEDTQAVAFGGQPLAMAVLTEGVPAGGATGLERFSNEQAVTDLERPLVRGLQSIDLISALLWLVAAGIIGSIMYLSVLERLRELAVLKAVGASNRSLLGGFAIQAVLLSAAAAVLAVGIATALAPVFPFTVEIPATAFPGWSGRPCSSAWPPAWSGSGGPSRSSPPWRSGGRDGRRRRP
jgi:putative ABC transport system permease protein